MSNDNCGCKIRIKVVKDSGVQLPKSMSELASGMDIYAHIKEPIILEPLQRAMVPTGIKLEIPAGYEVQVRPRSGLAAKHGITVLNTPGTIDADYRGEIKIILVNLSNEHYTIEPMERIAQLVVGKVYMCELEEVENLSESDRGEGGFGHTGKK